MDLFTEEPSLEYRLWRQAAIRNAFSILRGTADYRVTNIASSAKPSFTLSNYEQHIRTAQLLVVGVVWKVSGRP